MTLNASLKNRVLRLERMAAGRRRTVVERLQAAFDRVRGMSPAEIAADSLKRCDESLDLLQKPVASLDRFDRSRERSARRHLQAMAALNAPDLPKPAEGDLSPENVQRLWAWSEQQHLRADARRYLAQVEEARGLYTPRHWPLSAELINLARPRAHQENAHGAA